MHGVLRCSKCKTTWDRDANASLNMLLKALFIIEGRELPDTWQRADKSKGEVKATEDTGGEEECGEKKKRATKILK